MLRARGRRVGVIGNVANRRLCRFPRLEVLAAPFTVNERELDGKLAQIRHLLPLETVEVGLESGRRVLEVLCRGLKRVLELRCELQYARDLAHLGNIVPSLGNVGPPGRLWVDVHHATQAVLDSREQAE